MVWSACPGALGASARAQDLPQVQRQVASRASEWASEWALTACMCCCGPGDAGAVRPARAPCRSPNPAATQIDCVNTAPDGTYELGVVVGTTLIVNASYADHTFKAVSSSVSNASNIYVSGPIAGLNFQVCAMPRGRASAGASRR